MRKKKKKKNERERERDRERERERYITSIWVMKESVVGEVWTRWAMWFM